MNDVPAPRGSDSTASAPDRSGQPLSEPNRPPLVGAVLAGGWAGGAGAMLCAALAVIGWFSADGGTAGQAVRIGIGSWLVANLVPVELSNGTYSLAPLGLTAVVALVLLRAGHWIGTSCTMRGRRDLAAGALGLSLVYGAFAAIAAALAGSGSNGASPVRAFVTTGLLALLAGGIGLARATGGAWRVTTGLPLDVRAGLSGGLAGLGLLLVTGVGLVVVALAGNLGRAGDLMAALRPGPVGAVLLVLVCLVYVPNAAVYACAYMLGPGFALGTATVVAPTGVVLGELPTFPLLAAVPTGPAPWSVAVFLLPVLAGAAGGVIAGRGYLADGLAYGRWREARRPDLRRVELTALRGALAGAVAGVGFGLCAALASGSAGPGRMAELGPSPLSAGLVAVLTYAIAGAVAATLDHVRLQWRNPRPSAPPGD